MIFKSEFARYVFTIGFWTGVDYALAACLLALSVAPTVAVTIAYLTAVTLNYFHQKWFTFGHKLGFKNVEFLRYCVTVFFVWSLIVGSVYVGVELLGWHTLLAKLASQPITFFTGYMMMKHYVFVRGKE